MYCLRRRPLRNLPPPSPSAKKGTGGTRRSREVLLREVHPLDGLKALQLLALLHRRQLLWQGQAGRGRGRGRDQRGRMQRRGGEAGRFGVKAGRRQGGSAPVAGHGRAGGEGRGGEGKRRTTLVPQGSRPPACPQRPAARLACSMAALASSPSRSGYWLTNAFLGTTTATSWLSREEPYTQICKGGGGGAVGRKQGKQREVQPLALQKASSLLQHCCRTAAHTTQPAPHAPARPARCCCTAAPSTPQRCTRLQKRRGQAAVSQGVGVCSKTRAAAPGAPKCSPAGINVAQNSIQTNGLSRCCWCNTVQVLPLLAAPCGCRRTTWAPPASTPCRCRLRAA